jgi:3-hydroxyisobutyrate dehydrogenase/glyoxylate/succinic semialdehyde reductase
MKVGFIGTGIMGSRMAHNLLKNNYNLVVHNRTKQKADSLIKAGAEWADSPLEVGTEADIVFTMLSNPEAVEQSAFGEKGFLTVMKNNSIWVDFSTVNPSFSKRMAEKTKEYGIRFLDAPVAGTKQPAENGELIFFVGGNKKDFEEIVPILEAMGKKILHLGDCGKGTSMKMVVNLMLGAAMASFSEAAVLGESLGFDKEIILNVLIGGPVAAPYLSAKKEKFISGKYEADFPLQWMLKDLELVNKTADESGLTLQTTNAAKDIFRQANQNGVGEMDFSVLYKFLRTK